MVRLPRTVAVKDGPFLGPPEGLVLDGREHAGMLVCDVIPNPPDTRFLKQAQRQGARTLNGLGMLVYQGAIAFKLWTGVEPDVQVMRDALERFFATPHA